MTTITYTEALDVVHCHCGIALGIPSNLHRVALEDGRDIYCPLGHIFVYRDTVEKKLKREREKSARLQAELDQREASLKAQRAATKRFQNKVKRVEAGVCPHCRRNFQNLRRHMESKHAHG